MANTRIKETWNDSVQLGEVYQQKLRTLLEQIGYTTLPYGDGKQKQADIVVRYGSQTKTVEVKRDAMGDTTGNFAIEYEFRGQKSGLAATTADIFCIATATTFYCFKSQNLKDFLAANWKYLRKVKGGDSNDAKMVLVRQSDVRKRAWCVIQSDGTGASNFSTFFK